MTDVLKVSREKVSEAISALRSVNSGKTHEIRVPADDEPVYWQRKEWVCWAMQAGEELAADVERLNAESSLEPSQIAGVISVPSDALSLLTIWQSHLGSCRESCDDAGKQLWDRIEAVLEQAEPVQHGEGQAVGLVEGE